jgi:hypothetical protein
MVDFTTNGVPASGLFARGGDNVFNPTTSSPDTIDMGPRLDSPTFPGSPGGIDLSDLDIQKQLNNITSSDSPYMVQARNQGLQAARSRGLLNSLGAANAAQNNAYNVAIPLAQQNVKTLSDFKMKELSDQFNREMTELGIDSSNQQLMANLFADMVGSELDASARIMAPPDNVWDQTKQSDFENMINESKKWLMNLFGTSLST